MSNPQNPNELSTLIYYSIKEGATISEAFNQAIALRQLQGEKLSDRDISDIISCAKYPKYNAIYQLIVEAKLELNQDHLRLLYNNVPHLLKDQFHLLHDAPINVYQEEDRTSAIWLPPAYTCICSKEARYEYLAKYISLPQHVELFVKETYAHTTNQATNFTLTEEELLRRLHRLRQFFIKKMTVSDEIDIFKLAPSLYPALAVVPPSTAGAQYCPPIKELEALSKLFLSGLLPKKFVEYTFSAHISNLTLPHLQQELKLPEATIQNLLKLMEQTLRNYGILVADPTKWAQVPHAFVSYYKEYITNHNSVETTKAFMSYVLPEFTSCAYIKKQLPKHILSDLIRYLTYSPYNGAYSLYESERYAVGYGVPILYSLLDAQGKAAFWIELHTKEKDRHKSTNNVQYRASAHGFEFFLGVREQYLIHAKTKQPNPYILSDLIDMNDPEAKCWCEQILNEWKMSRCLDYEEYIDGLKSTNLYEEFKPLLSADSQSVAQLTALEVTPTSIHLKNAMDSDNVKNFTDLLGPTLSVEFNTNPDTCEQIVQYLADVPADNIFEALESSKNPVYAPLLQYISSKGNVP